MCLFGVVGYRCIHSNFIVVAVTLQAEGTGFNGNGQRISLLIDHLYRGGKIHAREDKNEKLEREMENNICTRKERDRLKDFVFDERGD